MGENLYEQQFNWVYYSSVKDGYLCKICELFAVEKDGQSEYKGVQLGGHVNFQSMLKDINMSAATRYSQFAANVNVFKQLQAPSQSN